MTTTLQQLVAHLTADIGIGRRWAPGDRLPPQRELARERRIAASTASRAYRELAQRGLVVGETGRGTYVRAAAAPLEPALAEPSEASYVDLALNVPILPEHARPLAASLARLMRDRAAFEQALRPTSVTGTAAAREVAAAYLSRDGWRVDTARMILAGNGKQALGAVVAAIVKPGDRLGTDALTYPLIKSIAAHLRVELVPLAMDDEGMRPDAIERAHLRTPLRAIYCQPVLHNPTGTSMSDRRRADIVRVLRRHRLVAIEDAVYSFLVPDAVPLAAAARERVVVIDSLSKRIAPGISIGMIIAPETLVARMADAVRSHACAPSGFALAACTRWMADGTAGRITAAKQRDAIARQRILRQAFEGLSVTSDPRAYHAWLTLPADRRADQFEAAAAREGIAVVRGAAFAVSPGHAPNAVRLALASPTHATLAKALATLAKLVRDTRRRRRPRT
jgi:DNA-binding transcriptional MocR family regulator